ncbi:MAG: hypothetical protein C4331_17250 [Meiothermus sp.]
MIIEIFADIACPWCYIGDTRLEKALRQRPDAEIELRWRPFQLQPGIPPEGLPWREFMVRKFGREGRMDAAFGQVAEAGKLDGLEFRFDRISRAINTVDAHRLVLLAERSGQGQQTAQALFRAYFTDGKNLSDAEQLLEVAAGVGLDRAAVGEFLATDELRAEVEDSQKLAYQFGIQGVPFYIFDRKYGVSGAQPLATFVQVLDRVQAEAASRV